MGLWPTKGDEGPLADARGSAWDAHCKQSRDRKGALEVWTFNGADSSVVIIISTTSDITGIAETVVLGKQSSNQKKSISAGAFPLLGMDSFHMSSSSWPWVAGLTRSYPLDRVTRYA